MNLESRNNIVVLDDDPMIPKIIEAATKKNIVHFPKTKALLNTFQTLNPLVIFVDIHLGVDDNGLDVLPKLKEKWPFCPIIVITSERDENAVGDALAAGADDFIYKPLNPKELLARMNARLTELYKRESKELYSIADLVVDSSHRMITNEKTGEQRFLSPTEISLLICLISAHGGVVRRDVIKRKCWGQIYVSDNALNRKLHEVRRVLKELSQEVQIKTVYGSGFSLELDQEPVEVKMVANG